MCCATSASCIKAARADLVQVQSRIVCKGSVHCIGKIPARKSGFYERPQQGQHTKASHCGEYIGLCEPARSRARIAEATCPSPGMWAFTARCQHVSILSVAFPSSITSATAAMWLRCRLCFHPHKT